jgi:hypothetical protein
VEAMGLDEASWRAHGETNLTGATDSLTFGSEGGAAISRWVDGLIPGQPYRLSLDIGSTATLVSIAVSGAGSTVVDADLEGEVRTLGLRGPYVHDFIAVAASHEVTIEQVTPGATTIYAIQVARTPVPLTTARMRFLETDIYEPNSWTFVATPTNVTATASVSSTPDLRLDWVATTGTPNVTTAVYARRLLRGLDVGRQYTLHLDLSTNNGQDVTVTVGGDSLTFTPTTSNRGDWIELHFTATAAQQEVHVGWGETFATSATVSRIRLGYLRLDVDDPSLLLEAPDLLEPAVRTLHQVSLISGPTVVQDFAPTAGAMQKVEFVLVAGSPYAYAPLDPIALPFDGTYQVIPDTACSLGQPIRRNYITNPSFETNTTGWTAGGGPLTRVVGVGKSGVAFGRITADGTASAFITTAGITVLPGSAYTLSAYVRANIAARFQAFLRNGSTALLVENVTLTPTGDMTRIEVTTIIPAGVTTITARIAGANPNGSNPAAGSLFDFDAIQFEAGAHASPYFDGSTSGGAWTGVAHASASTWTTIHTALIRDPDCTPIPPPPRAPIVIDDCIGSPTSWRRYHVVIPASNVPPWSAAVPVVTMSTRATAVRQIRVRFTALPYAVPIDQIDPCNFCGEFLVSYIPPNSTLTVDGILSQATINVRDTGLQTAQNLLYGTDAGPVVWPTLSCEVAYVMTVDVSPNEVTDFDVRLALARRE